MIGVRGSCRGSRAFSSVKLGVASSKTFIPSKLIWFVAQQCITHVPDNVPCATCQEWFCAHVDEINEVRRLKFYMNGNSCIIHVHALTWYSIPTNVSKEHREPQSPNTCNSGTFTKFLGGRSNPDVVAARYPRSETWERLISNKSSGPDWML